MIGDEQINQIRAWISAQHIDPEHQTFCMSKEFAAAVVTQIDILTMADDIDDDFLRKAVEEAEYQQTTWAEQDLQKTDADWMWLIGFLVGKAVHVNDKEKKLHNIQSAAASLAIWHDQIKVRH